MMFHSTRHDDLLFDFETFSEALSLATIDLEPKEIDRAAQLSRPIAEPNARWQTYLNALARCAVEQWLLERAPELSLEFDTRFEPEYTPLLSSASYGRVGDFTLCVLAMGNSIDEEIAIPRAAIELPEFAAHFYIAVEVCEEYEQATIRGVLQGDRLQRSQLREGLELDEDWTYSLPLSEFDLDGDRLLLNLRCLEPTAIALPEVPQRRTLHPRQRAQLVRIASELPASDRPWWQILNWEDAIALLTYPDVLVPISTMAAETPRVSAESPLVNVATWLRDELDRWAQEAAWVLLPSLSLSPSPMLRSHALMRDAASDLESMLQTLQREKRMAISPQARGAYQDFHLADVPVRLYAVTWEIPLNTGESEWALLLILAGQPGTTLPQGVTLQVSDETDILVRRTLAEDNSVLYTQVLGAWDERFGVKIGLASGETLTLPQFGFRSDRT